MENFVGKHRHTNYWDVIYDKRVKLEDFTFWNLHELNINAKNNSGPKRIVLDLSEPPQKTLENQAHQPSIDGDQTTIKNNKYFKDYVFTECDIRGSNKGKRITFDSCEFRKTFFGYCHLKNVKFKSCQFIDCSFAMSSFEDCQFNECNYKNTSYTGNETKMINTYIDAEKIVSSGFVNTDNKICSENGTTPEYQIYRANKTEAKFSKTLVNSLSSHPDDEAYYKSVKVHAKSKIKSKKSTLRQKSKESPWYKKPLFWLFLMVAKLEEIILKASGWANNWGGGLFKCSLVGVVIILLFSFVYQYVNNVSYGLAAMKSAEITLVAGYTKYSNTGTDFYISVIQLVNMVAGLWWYAILVPTLLNKVCASRS